MAAIAAPAHVALIWSTTLYHNGFAGSLVSMIAYVATTVLVYKTTLALTRSRVAGVVAAAVFALNVNMLYMQTTPMTESLLYCMIAATVYCIQQWALTDRYQYLLTGGVAAFLATLSRYESWPIHEHQTAGRAGWSGRPATWCSCSSCWEPHSRCC